MRPGWKGEVAPSDRWGFSPLVLQLKDFMSCKSMSVIGSLAEVRRAPVRLVSQICHFKHPQLGV